ncbi:MAG TPA: hypothetical protein VIK59_02455 [Verrucomicrobiae bacterium]
MKKIAIIILYLTGMTSITQATLIAGWDFSNLGGPSTTVSAMAGSGSLDLSAFANTQQDPVSGTSVNAFSGSEASSKISPGTALSLKNSSANGNSIIFSLDMLGYQDLVLIFATRGSSTGFNTHVWSYSTDGTTYVTLTGNNTAVTTSDFVTKTVDFTSFSALNDDASIFIKLTVNGAGSSSGDNVFDNIQFNAETYIAVIPEPAEYGLISAIGLLGICGAGIWRKQRAASTPENLPSEIRDQGFDFSLP